MQVNLSRIRMRHLRCFLAVAQHGTASRAAEVLGTVQPSISRSIREMEQEVGQALEGLRLQFPGYAEDLERRLIRQMVLSQEEREYAALVDDGLIGPELRHALWRLTTSSAGMAWRVGMLR